MFSPAVAQRLSAALAARHCGLAHVLSAQRTDAIGAKVQDSVDGFAALADPSNQVVELYK